MKRENLEKRINQLRKRLDGITRNGRVDLIWCIKYENSKPNFYFIINGLGFSKKNVKESELIASTLECF